MINCTLLKRFSPLLTMNMYKNISTKTKISHHFTRLVHLLRGFREGDQVDNQWFSNLTISMYINVIQDWPIARVREGDQPVKTGRCDVEHVEAGARLSIGILVNLIDILWLHFWHKTAKNCKIVKTCCCDVENVEAGARLRIGSWSSNSRWDFYLST